MRIWVLLLTVLLMLPACQRESPVIKRNEALNRAIKALSAGRSDEALRHIDAAIELDRGASHLHQIKGSILFHADRYEEALASYDQAFALNDRSAEAMLGAGLTLAKLGREGDAEARYVQAEALYGDRASNPPDAERLSQDAIDTAMIDARLHLALIAALRGQTTAALGQIDRLEKTYPQWEEASRWRRVIENGALEALLMPR